MNRHDFFKKRLAELEMYDKDSDYGGLIGKGVEELSALFGKQRHSGQSAILTLQLFNQLMVEYLPGEDTNPDDRNEGVEVVVRVYFKKNTLYEFPVLDTIHARAVATRIVKKGCYIRNEDGTEEYFPITEIYKVKILRVKTTPDEEREE